ncbi:hypothetical protein CKO31_05870 [Thiohalocapsa halophila]|uniref:Uncharacterized protein n=1 Tax=Thiohalocapsa halophila TaxID=69359 RepID=A0ABS1CFX0_9GAMM|nr:hypothetical protein [Thiohalocapsa halophila]MBK1630281.1 hypothetical protein [Thiohalocapsa halophila]
MVYFALDQFGRRKPYKHLEPGLERDIKAFFGDYTTARTQGLALLILAGAGARHPRPGRWPHRSEARPARGA